MLKRRRRKLPYSGNPDAPQMMNLALFIMLLAFFLVLNAISTFEAQRVSPIVQNLNLTFSTDVRFEDVRPSVQETPVQSVHDGDMIERLEALFQSQITDFKPRKNAARGILSVDVPLAAFSTAVMAVGQEDLSINRISPQNAKGTFFLPTLISVLKSDEQGRTYRIDMLYHVNGNPAELQNESPKVIADLSTRASGLTQKLEEAGMPQRLMTYGFQDGDEGMLTLVFSPHFPFDPSYGRDEEVEE